jgi:hypothetical protein
VYRIDSAEFFFIIIFSDDCPIGDVHGPAMIGRRTARH